MKTNDKNISFAAEASGISLFISLLPVSGVFLYSLLAHPVFSPVINILITAFVLAINIIDLTAMILFIKYAVKGRISGCISALFAGFLTSTSFAGLNILIFSPAMNRSSFIYCFISGLLFMTASLLVSTKKFDKLTV